MKILVLTNLYPPYSVSEYEVRCATVTDQLREKGHQVRVLTSNHGLPQKSASQTSADLTINPERQEKNISRALRLHGHFGHPWLGISKLKHLELYNNEALQDTLHRFKPEIVHVWNMAGLSKSLLLTLQKSGIPVVYDVADYWIARSLKWDVWLRWWNRRDISRINKVRRWFAQTFGNRKRIQNLAPTNPIEHIQFRRIYFSCKRLKQATLEAGYPVSHAEIIYCPVNTTVFTGLPKSHNQPLHKLLFVGNLSEDNGIMTVLRTMYELIDKFSGTLTVCGDGDLHYVERLKQFVTEERLPVVFTNLKNSTEMAEVYRNHDALLFTPEYDTPDFTIPLEGMACGLPVICSTRGGAAELISNDETGLNYHYGDAAALAQQILKLASNGEFRYKIASKGQKRILDRYSEPNIVSQIEAYLHTTLNQWTPSSLPGYKTSADYKIK